MTITPFAPGMRLTAERLNLGMSFGRLVFRAERATAQPIANSSPSAITDYISWDSVQVDLFGGFSGGAPTLYTPTVAGWYGVFVSVGFQGNATGIRLQVVEKNGTSVDGTFNRQDLAASAIFGLPPRPAPVGMNGTTDAIRFGVGQTSGSALDTNATSSRPLIAVYYAGPL